MTAERSEEMLAKIKMVADNDIDAFSGTASSIKVSKDSKTNDIVIDMVVFFLKSDEDEPTHRLNFSYATCKSTIKEATKGEEENAYALVQNLISSSLRGLDMPGGEAELAAIQA